MAEIVVELVNTAGGDLSVVNSARVSFNKIVESMGEGDEKLIRYLADHKHMTPFRHNFIQLRCKAPIFLARQLGKHQAGLSWNEVSRRYVKDAPEFYFPEEWRAAPDGSIKQGSGGVHAENIAIKKDYARMVEDLLDMYDTLIDSKVAPEMARMVLPQSMMTEWIWSGNLLAFAHVYKERIADGAQEEAKVFAQQLDDIIRPQFPIAWTALVGERK